MATILGECGCGCGAGSCCANWNTLTDFSGYGGGSGCGTWPRNHVWGSMAQDGSAIPSTAYSVSTYLVATTPAAANPDAYTVRFDWADLGLTEGDVIAMPLTVSLGAVVDLAFFDEGGGAEYRTSQFPFYSGDFATGIGLAFFRTVSPPPPPIVTSAPGGPVTIEPSVPVCAIGLSIEHNNATFRDDLFFETWDEDGVYDGIYSGLFVDATATTGPGYAPHYAMFRICSRKFISKVRFGFAGSAFSGAADIPFAIDSVGVCMGTTSPPGLSVLRQENDFALEWEDRTIMQLEA